MLRYAGRQCCGARVNIAFQKVAVLLVTGAGVGYIPRFPGTLGTILAIPLSLALNRIALNNFLFATVLLIGAFAGAVWLCSPLAGMLKRKDPQFIVIDESSVSLWPISLLPLA